MDQRTISTQATNEEDHTSIFPITCVAPSSKSIFNSKQQQHRLPTATSQIFSCLFQNCKSVQSNGGCVLLEPATDQPTIHKRRTQFTQTTTSTLRRWCLGKCAPSWTLSVHQPLICRSTSAHYKQYSPAIVLFNLNSNWYTLGGNLFRWQSAYLTVDTQMSWKWKAKNSLLLICASIFFCLVLPFSLLLPFMF